MKLVKAERVNAPSLTKELNISNLAQGIYFIRYTQGKLVKTLPFIKD